MKAGGKQNLQVKSACHLLLRWFLAHLIFLDPKDKGNMFLRNVG
jgi:hypothetical protein